MKSSLCMLMILSLFSFLLIAGCAQLQNQSSTEDSLDQYFPMKVGSEWIYTVDVKENGAVIYKTMPKSVRREGIYSQNKGNSLVIRIEKTVNEECDYKYSDSLQLKIIKDDLNIFKYDAEIFWIKLGLSSANTYMVNQVTRLSESSIGNRCSEKVLFIADRENKGISQFGSKEEMFYLGKEKITYKYQIVECMHFKRTITSSENPSIYLGKKFTEDSWYVPGKGLIRMEQKIEDKTSMIWELESFKSG